MATGFADAFLESVFQGRKENADRQKFNANLQFEQAKSAQQNQIEQQRLQNEQMYQQAMIKDTQDRNAREGQQYQQSQDWTKTLAGFNAQSQGLATPVQPDVNTRAAGLPLQQAPQGGIPTPAPGGGMIPQIGPRPQAGPLGPPPPSVGPPVMNDQGQPAMQAGALPATMPDRTGAVVQAPPGATQFGDAGYLRPRTVEERMAAEHATKLKQDSDDQQARATKNLEMGNTFFTDPANKFTPEQQQAGLTYIHLNNLAEQLDPEHKNGINAGTLKEIINPTAVGGQKLSVDEMRAGAAKVLAGLPAPEIQGLSKDPVQARAQAKILHDTLSPPKPTDDSKELNRNLSSYKFSTTEVDKEAKAVNDTSDAVDKANALLSSPNEVGSAMAPLALLQLIKGGSRGMSPALAKTIEGNRTYLESAAVTASKLGPGGKATQLSKQQVDAAKQVVAAFKAEIQPRKEAVAQAYQDLSPSDPPEVHGKILQKLHAARSLATAQTDTGGFNVDAIKAQLGKK